MEARILRASPVWAREMLRVASFRITEAMWFCDGTLVVHFSSIVRVSNWVLAELPQHLRIAGEVVEAEFQDQLPFITGKETAVAVYQTAVSLSEPLLLKERKSSEESDAIVLEAC